MSDNSKIEWTDATWKDGRVVWIQPEDIVVDAPAEADEPS